MGHLYSFRKSPEEARAHFGYAEQPDFPPLAHVRTGGPIAIVRAEKGVRHYALVRWGFIPSWTKVIRPGNPLINARAETVIEKPSFKHAVRRRRCLVPADGFYEFTTPADPKKKRKDKWLFRKNGEPIFAIAGIWRETADVGEAYTMLTMEPGPDIAPYHDRQIVILQREAWADWLDSSVSAQSLIRPLPERSLSVQQVG